MSLHPTEQAPTHAVGAPPQPALLDIALRLGQRILADYADSHRPGFNYAAAFGATHEALRLLLRAHGAEPPALRCPAAHPEDPTSCGGPVVVTVLDRDNAGAAGCEHHAARLQASLDGGRVYALPTAPDGAAIRTFKTASTLRPYPWREAGR